MHSRRFMLCSNSQDFISGDDFIRELREFSLIELGNRSFLKQSETICRFQQPRTQPEI